MWILRHMVPGALPPSGPVRYRSALTRWQRVRWTGAGGASHAAYIPDDHPEADEIRAMVRRMGSTSIVDDSKIAPLDPPVPVRAPDPVELPTKVDDGSPVAFSRSDVESIATATGFGDLFSPEAPPLAPELAAKIRGILYLCKIVQTNGWTFDDFRGTGKLGDPTEVGGRSPVTGLTLMELTLTRPPEDWHELHAQGKPPWLSADWHPPQPGWIPPSWPGTGRDLLELDPEKPPDLKPGTITDPEAYARAKAAGLITEIPPGDPRATTGPVTVVVDAGAIGGPGPHPSASDPGDLGDQDDTTAEVPGPDGEEHDDVEDPASSDGDPLASYPADFLETAREIVLDLAKRQHKHPHPNAANHWIDRATGGDKSKHVNTAQIAALIGDVDLS